MFLCRLQDTSLLAFHYDKSVTRPDATDPSHWHRDCTHMISSILPNGYIPVQEQLNLAKDSPTAISLPALYLSDSPLNWMKQPAVLIQILKRNSKSFYGT